MKTAIFSIFFIFISIVSNAQIDNKLVLREKSSRYTSSHSKFIELPQQMMVNWYDTLGIEHNDDKLLLYVIKDTLYFDVPKNDTLVEAIAYNQIEYIRMFNVGKIILKPVAIVSSFFFAYGTVGAAALFAYGLTSYRSSEGGVFIFGAFIIAAIDIPLYFISKALWNGSNMTYKTEKWKLLKR